MTAQDSKSEELEIKRFDHYEEAFHWLFLNGIDGWDDYMALLNMITEITIEDMERLKARNVKEFMVLNHDYIYKAPYGFLYIKE